MKKFILSLLAIALTSSILIAQTEPGARRINPDLYFSHIPIELQGVIQAILQVSETHQLLESVRREGKIRLELRRDSSHEYEALWNQSQRLIAINTLHCQKNGDRIRCVLFELHNAKTNGQFGYYDNLARTGQLTKESYVQTIERLEHTNVIETAKLLDRGIQGGQFPSDARWDMMQDFSDHYKMQQLTGHSSQIAGAFDRLFRRSKPNPFKGSISQLGQLTQKEKDLLTQYLWTKASMTSGTQDEKRLAARFLEQERQKLGAGQSIPRHRQFLALVFGELVTQVE